MGPVATFVVTAQALPELRPGQRHGHVERDLGQWQVEGEREGLLDVGRTLAGVADDEEGGDLDAGFAVHGRRAHALLDGHPFPHEVQRRLASRLEPEIDAAATGLVHEARRGGLDAVGAREAAPGEPQRRHPPAELLEVVAVEREGVVGDPQAVVPEAHDVVDLGEHRVERAQPDVVAEDRLGAELAAVGAAEGGQQRRRPVPGRRRPLALVGGVVEIVAVGQGKAGNLRLRVMHRGVVDAHAIVVAHQAGVLQERKVATVAGVARSST